MIIIVVTTCAPLRAPIMSDKLPFSWRKPGSPLIYFRRRVPDDIKPLLTAVASPHAGKAYIVVSLKTSDPKVAAKRIAKMVRQTDEEWKALRNPSRAASLRQAHELLKRHGVDPLDPEADESALARFFEAVQGQPPLRAPKPPLPSQAVEWSSVFRPYSRQL